MGRCSCLCRESGRLTASQVEWRALRGLDGLVTFLTRRARRDWARTPVFPLDTDDYQGNQQDAHGWQSQPRDAEPGEIEQEERDSRRAGDQ